MATTKGRLRIKLAIIANRKYLKLIGEFNDQCYAKLELTDYQFRRAFQGVIDSEFLRKYNIDEYEHKIRILEKRIKILESERKGKEPENGNRENKIL